MPSTPTGELHEVGVDELFFSTTDDKGVIQRANDVFVRLSHFDASSLSDAPHNLVRHPAMPAAAFRVMWDTLKAGQPFAAYVRNLAATGSEYRVFATITPLRAGGYLSVRSRPMRPDLEQTAYSLYEQVLDLEHAAAANGASRRQVAEQGATRLVGLLSESGLESYESFQNLALPAEVASREEASSGLPQRPDATGPLAQALSAVHALSAGLDSWMSRLEELSDLDQSLRRASKRLGRAVGTGTINEQTVSTLDRSDAQVATLAQLLDLWLQMQALVTPQVARLQQTLAQMETNVGRTRFRIALARLHASMTATFLAELIDAAQGPQEQAGGTSQDTILTQGAVNDLGQALQEGVEDLASQAASYRDLAQRTSEAVGQVERLLTVPHQLLELWTSSPRASDPTLADSARSLTRAASTALSDSERILSDLAGLAHQCTATSGSGSTGTELLELVTQVGDAVAATAPQDR